MSTSIHCGTAAPVQKEGPFTSCSDRYSQVCHLQARPCQLGGDIGDLGGSLAISKNSVLLTKRHLLVRTLHFLSSESERERIGRPGRCSSLFVSSAPPCGCRAGRCRSRCSRRWSESRPKLNCPIPPAPCLRTSSKPRFWGSIPLHHRGATCRKGRPLISAARVGAQVGIRSSEGGS